MKKSLFILCLMMTGLNYLFGQKEDFSVPPKSIPNTTPKKPQYVHINSVQFTKWVDIKIDSVKKIEIVELASSANMGMDKRGNVQSINTTVERFLIDDNLYMDADKTENIYLGKLFIRDSTSHLLYKKAMSGLSMRKTGSVFLFGGAMIGISLLTRQSPISFVGLGFAGTGIIMLGKGGKKYHQNIKAACDTFTKKFNTTKKRHSYYGNQAVYMEIAYQRFLSTQDRQLRF